MDRIVGVAGAYERESIGGMDGLDDFRSVDGARQHISRSDPAVDPLSLEERAYVFGYVEIVGGVADEYLLCHRLTRLRPV